MGRRGRRWPSGTLVGDAIHVHQPIVVAEPVRPSKIFAALVAAIGLPEEEVRFVISDVLDDPELTPEALTAAQLAHFGPALLRSIDGLAELPDAERRAVHRRVESLLRAAAHR